MLLNTLILALSFHSVTSITEVRPISPTYHSVIIEGGLKVTVRVEPPEQVIISGPSSAAISKVQTIIDDLGQLVIRPGVLSAAEIGQLSITAYVHHGLGITGAIAVAANTNSIVQVVNVTPGLTLALGANDGGQVTSSGTDVRWLTGSIHGTGVITATGKASESLQLKISGAGRFNGANLETQSAVIQVVGSAEVSVFVHGEISGHVDGSAVIRHKNNPQITLTTNGHTDLIKL